MDGLESEKYARSDIGEPIEFLVWSRCPDVLPSWPVRPVAVSGTALFKGNTSVLASLGDPFRLTNMPIGDRS